MKLKFGVYNNWKDLKYGLFFLYLFGIYFSRFFDCYRFGFCLFGFEFMIELRFKKGDSQ